jgi:methylglutaconyl-CoA hydratase
MTGENAVTLDVVKGIARVTLNRPEKHNAFDEEMLAAVTGLFRELGKRDDVRVIVFTGTGPSFCAGADLDWMRKVAGYTKEQNLEDAERLARMFFVVHECPKPVIGRINGNALGGGAGLVASCDIAIAAKEAFFSFPEVKLGIIPAVISPYVIKKLGPSKSRELFITGERFDAQKALEYGLVSAAVPNEELDAAVENKIKFIWSSGPQAVAECKELVKNVSKLDGEDAVKYTVEKIADLRSTPEGKEGMEAFLQKRKAKWCGE